MSLRTLLGSVVVLAAGSVAMAAISNPHVAGAMQGWDPGSDAMTETSPGSGVFTRTYTGLPANTRYEWKVTDGTWSNGIPGGGGNSWLFTDGSGNVTITYDSNTHSDGWSTTTDRLGLSTDPGTWTAAGAFEGWSNNNPAAAMVSEGGGLYAYNAVLAPGDYTWKAVVTGSWDSISYDGRNTNTSDWSFHLDAGQYAKLEVDSLGGTVRTSILSVPEPTSIGLLGLAGMALVRRRRA